MFIVRTALKDIRRRLRDPAAFAIWLGIPIALGAAISLAFGGLSGDEAPTAEIWVVDRDESVVSGFLVTALAAGGDLGFPLVAREVEADEGRSLIERGKGSALLIIPANFGDDVLNGFPTRLELVTNPTQRILPHMVEESLGLIVDAVFYLQQTVGDPISRIVNTADTTDGFLGNSDVAEISILINEATRRMNALLFPPVIDFAVATSIEPAAIDSTVSEIGLIDIFLPPMLFMALFFMALGISEDVWVEKQQGTMRRALATPNASAGFLAGKLLASTLLMAIVAFVSLVGARYLLGANAQNLWLAGLWITLSGACFMTLLYCLQLFATSQRGGGVLSSLIMIPLLMLGGSFFPFEMMPEGMVRIGRMTPNGWALTELVGILQDNVDWSRLAVSAAGLVVTGIVFFIVANHRLAGAFARS